MKNTLLLLFLLLVASIRLDAQQVVFDPATYEPDSLPAGMTIVDIGGTAYLQVITDGWSSALQVTPLPVNAHYTQFSCEVKYAIGASGYTLGEVNTFLKLANSDFSVEIGANGAASTADFAVRNVNIAAHDTIGALQVAGQHNSGSWEAVVGDTMWVGKVTLIDANTPNLIDYMITRETFGTVDYGTNNTRPQPTGWTNGTAWHWDWWEVTSFTSENGYIETGSDSSIRIVNYAGGMPVPAEWPEPSGGQHLLMTTPGSYMGSWDTLYFLGIDIAEKMVTSVEFAHAKRDHPGAPRDTFIRGLNVEIRIDGGDWMSLDTSLMASPFLWQAWEYVALPINYLEGAVMDIRIADYMNQAFIDDLSVFGIGEPPAGTNDFTVANIVFGTVDDAADFTCNLHMSWDADSIYMEYVIADDSIVNTGATYQVDNLEIYLDLDNSKNIHYPRNGGWMQTVDAAYDDNDFQFRLVPELAFDVVNTGRPSLLATGGAKQVYTETAEGYTFVLNIAWDSLMVGFEPAEEDLIGFDALISDNDAVANDANRNQITFNSPTDKPFNDPSLFATMQLKAEGRLQIIPDEEPPAAPENFAGVAEGSRVTLTWDLADDNVAVLKYVVAAGAVTLGEPYAQAAGNTFSVADQTPGDHSYAVRSVDNYGLMSAWSSITVTVPEPESISNPKDAEFAVYPNPANSVLTVKGIQDIQSIEVISITGAIVLNEKNTDRIDVSVLESGMYLIKVQTSDNIYSTTFVKE
jgi:hypothetical protein